MGDYRKLEIWKEACRVADEMHVLFDKLSKRVQSNLGDQVLRAADSVHLNIAEGSGFNSDPQFAKYVRQSISSLNEVENVLIRLTARQQVPEGHERLLPDVELLKRRIGAFLQSLL